MGGGLGSLAAPRRENRKRTHTHTPRAGETEWESSFVRVKTTVAVRGSARTRGVEKFGPLFSDDDHDGFYASHTPLAYTRLGYKCSAVTITTLGFCSDRFVVSLGM